MIFVAADPFDYKVSHAAASAAATSLTSHVGIHWTCQYVLRGVDVSVLATMPPRHGPPLDLE